MAQMCLVRDRGVPEDCAGTFIMPLMPTGGLMSSELLTEFIGEFNCNIYTHKKTTQTCLDTLVKGVFFKGSNPKRNPRGSGTS